jgi:uncharacterized protein (TIGR04255 family)
MPIRYRNTPLVEAVFETFFVGGQWDGGVLAKLDARLGVEFAGHRDEMQNFPGIEFRMTPTGPRVRATQQQPPKYRRWDVPGKRLVQYSAEMCAFNALKPYTHYVDYRPDMEKLFRAYVEESRPPAVRFLGQRYINRVSLPSVDEHPSGYFTIYPEEVPHDRRGVIFSMQVQTELVAHGRVVMNLAFQTVEAGQPVYVLDVYARTDEKPSIRLEWSDVAAWQDEAHGAVKRAFELALTDKCRTLLGREEY